MSSNFLFWPRENECNDGTGNHREFALIIYQSYLLTNLVLIDINLFKFVVIFNYLVVNNGIHRLSMDSENCPQPRPQRFVLA